jgi:ADP-L-glycero-D-manno-heptose 6-epimerase
MVVITGALGFIGSIVSQQFFRAGKEIILVDDFSRKEKINNIAGLENCTQIDREDFLHKLEDNSLDIDLIVHLGARTDTAEKSVELFNKLNLFYSQKVWNYCSENKIPLVYASSAATYGDGTLGFNDDHGIISSLKPLNPYGDSKNDFDIWALKQTQTPPFWAGLKFFNVYGPNEFHKGRMASVIFHTYNQVKSTNAMKLFRSHNADFKDGEQLRDFIYVKDIASVIEFLSQQKDSKNSGVYNLGTGKARSFYDLAANTFLAMDKEVNISFIDIPEDIRDTYQYFTEANMNKLKSIGYNKPFTSLEDGIKDYVSNYLLKENYF